MIPPSLPLILPGTIGPAGWFVDALQSGTRSDGRRWYPLTPLMSAAGIRSMVELRMSFPMSGQQYRQVLDRGLTELQADRWAVRLGLVAAEVWPELVDHGIADAEIVCASSDCATRFVPRDLRGQQRYCSARCRHRERARRYRATEPGAEAARRARRAYYWSDPKIRAYEASVKKAQRVAQQEAA